MSFQVHLVDGTYELFRSHFGAPSATDPQGREVGATRGFLRSLHSLLRRDDVTHVACAFDTKVESFRNDLFDGYKTGEGIEAELLEQFPLVERAAEALGVVTWRMIEFEADDALATGARIAAADDRVERVVICTPDKDLAQSLVGERVVRWDRRRDLWLDEAGVREQYGILPASIPDWLALVGDAADGVPGVPRWGAKSASTVLGHYEHLESIPADPDAWEVKVRGRAALAQSLAEHQEEARLYRTLTTLRDDVPLTEGVDHLAWSGVDRALLETLCTEIDDARFLGTVS